MDKRKAIVGAMAALIAVGTMAQSNKAFADDAKPAKKAADKKNHCKGKDHCSGSCSGKDGCKAKDSCKGKDGCKGKDHGHDAKEGSAGAETPKAE